MSNNSIIIAGAGIAGLTCALSLAKTGSDVTIIESFDTPHEVGAGIQVPPNAWRILEKLGLGKALNDAAIKPVAIALGDAHSGKIVLDIPVNQAQSNHGYFGAIHRAKLHGVLWDAARSNPNITLVTGSKVQNVVENDETVQIQCTATDGPKNFEASILIGADGIWSNVRRFVPSADIPKPTGRVALRAMAPSLTNTNFPKVTAWMASKCHIVTYPVRNTDTVNIVAIIDGAAHSANWSEKMDGQLPLDLAHALKHVTTTRPSEIPFNRWPLYVVEPNSKWHSKRICLIGDAAHGMEPFAAQGAAMGIEDAFELAYFLNANGKDDPSIAFEKFYHHRLDRTIKVAKRTQFNRFAYHQRGPGRLARNFLFATQPSEKFMRDLDWLYAYRAKGL